MRNARLLRFPFAAGLAALLLALPFLYRSASAQISRQPEQQPADGTVTTTLADQSELAVTVYNSDLALVRDVRELTLPPGVSQLQVHGHCRVHQSRDGAFPLADGSREADRARAELRIRPARARKSCSRNTWAAKSRWCARQVERHDAMKK